uniref:Uncharacterized protein n=1 Tax=Arundo donax TaxID=35708 RepID=A0A0A9BFB1_ARUDO
MRRMLIILFYMRSIKCREVWKSREENLI